MFLNYFMEKFQHRTPSGLKHLQQMSWPVAMLLDVLLSPLLVCALVWVRRRQALVLRDGIPLTRIQAELALALGVASCERVRVVTAAIVPIPLPRWARGMAQRAGWVSPHIVGMTLGHGIVLREDYCDDMGLLAHELAHVSQYERLGGVAGFLRHYLRECVWPGYPHGALELEARAAEARGSMRPVDVIPYFDNGAAGYTVPPQMT